MKALDLLGQSREIARCLSLGVRRDEMQPWRGGVLPLLTEARWMELMPAHAREVQARLDAELEHLQPTGGQQEPFTSEPVRSHATLR